MLQRIGICTGLIVGAIMAVIGIHGSWPWIADGHWIGPVIVLAYVSLPGAFASAGLAVAMTVEERRRNR